MPALQPKGYADGGSLRRDLERTIDAKFRALTHLIDYLRVDIDPLAGQLHWSSLLTLVYHLPVLSLPRFRPL